MTIEYPDFEEAKLTSIDDFEEASWAILCSLAGAYQDMFYELKEAEMHEVEKMPPMFISLIKQPEPDIFLAYFCVRDKVWQGKDEYNIMFSLYYDDFTVESSFHALCSRLADITFKALASVLKIDTSELGLEQDDA